MNDKSIDPNFPWHHLRRPAPLHEEGAASSEPRFAVSDALMANVRRQEHDRDRILRELILEGLDREIQRAVTGSGAPTVYRGGEFLCMEFPHCHLRVIGYLQLKGFPRGPVEQIGLSNEMMRLGLAMLWWDAKGRPSHCWRVYTDADPKSEGLAATLVAIDLLHDPQLLRDGGAVVIEGSRRRARDRRVDVSRSPLSLG